MTLSNWIPDRKVWGGGLAMLAAWFCVQAARRLGLDLSIDEAGAIVGAAGLVIGYLLSPAWRDRLRVVDAALIEAAARGHPATPPALAGLLADAEVGRAVLAGSDLPRPSPEAQPPQTGTPPVMPRRGAEGFPEAPCPSVESSVACHPTGGRHAYD